MAVESLKPQPEAHVIKELDDLVKSAQAGDAGALPKIRRILDNNPAIWQFVGNLSQLVEHAWIAVLAGDEPLAAESMRRTIDDMKAKLAGENPTCLEKMIVDQIIAGWMEMRLLDALSADPGRGSVVQGALQLKRRESTHKRYLAAMKMLTTTRLLPAAALAPRQAVRLFEPKIKQA
jgi:hypothetical protein